MSHPVQNNTLKEISTNYLTTTNAAATTTKRIFVENFMLKVKY